MGLGCSQATLARFPEATFGIQDGQFAVVAISDGSIGTDTGLHIGDPVANLAAAYPGIVSDASPSDAYTTRYRYVEDGRTAEFLSFNQQTIDWMQFGLTNSVGEAPCV
jgi:hypothetical protein